MYDVIADEIEKFEQDEEEGLSTTRSNNYLRESHYEDEFTGQEIEFMQARVQEAIEDYLHMNEIESFKVHSDWCVHVIDKGLYEKLANGVSHTTDRIDKIEFTERQIQEFEEADKEDEELIQDVYADIEYSHLIEIKSDLEHALGVGSIVLEMPEDEVTIKVLMDLINEKIQNN